MKYGFLSFCSCLLVIGILFTTGCKKENEKSCVERVNDEFDDYERVEVIDADVRFIFTERDTTIFSYTGHDTLVFEVMDSMGAVTDTVEFFGQGKQIWFNNIGPHMINHECMATKYEETMDIAFFPGDTSYDKLLFKLTAQMGTAHVNFKYNGHVMSGLTGQINWVEYGGYMNVFEMRGKQFYSVSYFTRKSPLGEVEYYMNKQNNLFLYVLNKEKWFLKIN